MSDNRNSPSGKRKIFTFQISNDPGLVNPNVTQQLTSPVRLRASDIILKVYRTGGWVISQGGMVVQAFVDASTSPPNLRLDYIAPGAQTPGLTTYTVVVFRP